MAAGRTGLRPGPALGLWLALLVLLGAGLAPVPARAADPDTPISPRHLAMRMVADQQAAATYLAEARQLAAGPAAASPLDQVRHDLLLADALYRHRWAIRDEQRVLFQMAADPALERAVTPWLPAGAGVGIGDALAGMRSYWAAVGVDDPGAIRARFTRHFEASLPVETLLGYYRDSAARWGLDWTYLAAINYVETDFGRVNGPSGAGALGPMQFLPSTWAQYGRGGDVSLPRDAIEGAAYYLSRMGAPGNWDLALRRYNNDGDYVAAVRQLASAMRQDPAWLTRLYYWSTAG